MTILAWPRKHKILTFCLTILILLAGAIAYEAIAYRLNKRAWYQANENINTIYGDIVAKVGKPDDFKSYGDCRGFRGPYGEDSAITCELFISFIYPINGEAEADSLRSKIQNIVNTHKDLFTTANAPPEESIYGHSNLADGAQINNYYQSQKGIACHVTYAWNPDFDTRLKLKKPRGKMQFYASIGCTDEARGKFFIN